MYKKLIDPISQQEASCIKRISDGAFIPTNKSNRDYQEYLEWVAEGNEPEPAE